MSHGKPPPEERGGRVSGKARRECSGTHPLAFPLLWVFGNHRSSIILPQIFLKICSLCSSPQVHLRLKDFDFRKIMIDTPGEARYTRTNLAFSHHQYPHQHPE